MKGSCLVVSRKIGRSRGSEIVSLVYIYISCDGGASKQHVFLGQHTRHNKSSSDADRTGKIWQQRATQYKGFLEAAVPAGNQCFQVTENVSSIKWPCPHFQLRCCLCSEHAVNSGSSTPSERAMPYLLCCWQAAGATA